MGDILTQDEITNLISTFEQGENKPAAEGAAPQQVRTYDFRRPSKFSKEQIRTLAMIHQTFARLASTTLSTHLRSQMRVDLVGVDQLTYDEFIRSVPSPTLLCIFAFAAEEGNAILEINPSLAYTVIERMLGGKGSRPEKTRELTDIERALMSRIASLALRDLGAAWSGLMDIAPELRAVTTSTLFTQVALPGDMVMVVTLEVELCGITSMMSVCVPVIALEPIMSRLSAQQWFSAVHKGNAEDTTRSISEHLSDAGLLVRVILGQASVRMGDLAELAVGDVIGLDTAYDEDLALFVEGERKFVGRPGLCGKRVGLQVTRAAPPSRKM